MEGKKCFICIGFLIALFSVPQLLPARTIYKQAIYMAYIKGDMDKWEDVIQEMESAGMATVEDKLELLNYYYGYIGYLIGNEKSKKASLYIKKGEQLIEEVLEASPDNPTAYAYKGSFIGFKIGLSRFKAVNLGPQSMKYINKAYKLNPDNVQAVLDKANMLYYTPKLFGGNKKEAIRMLEKALELFETRGNTAYNWAYLNSLVLLGQYYEESGQKQDALSVYKKALRKEPDFDWVKNELYPSLSGKTK